MVFDLPLKLVLIIGLGLIPLYLIAAPLLDQISLKRFQRRAKKLEKAWKGGIQGPLGWRTWSVDKKGFLRGEVHFGYIWTEFSKADQPPTPYNVHGLYAHKSSKCPSLSPRYFLGNTQAMGLVELRGKVEEHSDGTLRGEFARILEIRLREDNPKVRRNYSNIPVEVRGYL